MTKRDRTCCFTGHRDIPESDLPRIIDNTTAIIENLIGCGYKYFGVGGAIGFDTLAADILFRLRKRYPHIKVILVYPFDGYTSRWTTQQINKHKEQLSKFDKVVCVCNTPSKGAYLERNRHLINFSSYCVCYSTRNYGGTAYTVDYAISQGVKIYNVAK